MGQNLTKGLFSGEAESLIVFCGMNERFVCAACFLLSSFAVFCCNLKREQPESVGCGRDWYHRVCACECVRVGIPSYGYLFYCLDISSVLEGLVVTPGSQAKHDALILFIVRYTLWTFIRSMCVWCQGIPNIPWYISPPPHGQQQPAIGCGESFLQLFDLLQ